MILTDSMLEAAYQFRMIEPWEILTDSDVFATILSDGTKVYCSVMGNGGQHHSLGIYIGDEGFSTFLNTLKANNLSHIELMIATTELDNINCDFLQAKDIEEKVKTRVRDYAQRNSIKIPRSYGWIDFTRFTPYKHRWFITQEHDALVAEETLRAATFFAKGLQENTISHSCLDPKHKYPTIKGGKTIPLITKDEEGLYHITTTTTPPLIKREYLTPTFDNDILANKLKGMEKDHSLTVRLLHMPVPVETEDDETPSVTGVLLMLDAEDDYLFDPITTSDYPNNPQRLLTQFANALGENDICPKRIIVKDRKTYLLIKNFCKRCDIRLRLLNYTPEMDKICLQLTAQMMTSMWY